MTVVLDTHTWIWFLNADPRLGREARTGIEAATLLDDAVLSAITLWEISILVARGRLFLSRDPREWLEFHLTRLPQGDPADRIIIATARHLDALLFTADYARAGHVKVLNAVAWPVADVGLNALSS